MSRGRRRPGAGRKPGSPNKATKEIRELAAPYGPAAIDRLAELMQSEDGKTALAACRELLDRGYGKSTQPVQADAGSGTDIAEEIRKARWRAQARMDGETAKEREDA